MAPASVPPARTHGIARLRRDPSGLVGISVAGPESADIASPADLPEHLVELHAFARREAATGFSEGVRAASSNVVHASPACGPGSLLVLVARLDHLRNPAAATLDEAVPIVIHGSGAVPSAALAAAEHEETVYVRQSAETSARSSWSDVEQAFASLPRPRKRHPKEFVWRMIALDVRKTPDYMPTGEALLEGTFDPAPPLPKEGGSLMHTEHRIYLRRQAGGDVVARLDLIGSRVALSRDSVRWREAEIERACADAGWTWDAGSLSPVWVGQAGEDGGERLRAALLEVPKLIRESARLSEEAGKIQRAAEIASDPQLAPIIGVLAADLSARIREAKPGQGYPRLDTPHGARDITKRALERLVNLGMVGIDTPSRSGGARVWALSPRGLAAATGGAEALAEAIRDGRTELAIRDPDAQDGVQAADPISPRH